MNETPKKVRLDRETIEFVGDKDSDEVGKLFFRENNTYRAIYADKTGYIQELLGSGLIDELSQKGLFPRTTLTPFEIDGFGLVLEHETIPTVTYPSEWSIDMLRDAARMILEVNIIAARYGYQTMDCHGYNILFHYTRPVYVDLGSFVKKPAGFTGWLAYEEFLRSYYYPLKIAASGNLYFTRLILSNTSSMPHCGYYHYSRPLSRLFSQSKVDFFFTNYYKFKLMSYFPAEDIRQKVPKRLAEVFISLKEKRLLPFQKVNLSALKRKVERIELKNTATQWGDYHTGLQAGGGITSTPRFDRIIELINQYPIRSVLELGGNQGVFSQMIAERTGVQRIICTDYDETAVNRMYQRLRETTLPIAPAILDFVSPAENNYGQKTSRRFKSDAVFALALTHHLILTQKMPVKKIFEKVATYTNRYVFIEFMPLGLYSATSKREQVPPPWYTLDWYKRHFAQYFTLLHEEPLEKNRILLVGELVK